jgi:hypothetical protein
MPSFESSFAVATVTLATEKRDSKIKPSLILIDNGSSAADAVLTFNDIFTPSATVGAPIPVLTTVPRLHITVPAGECDSLEDELKDMEFLGLVQVIRGAVDALSFVTFAYDLL